MNDANIARVPADTVTVPLRWVDEVVLALDAATTIGIRSCNPGDGLHIGNHDRLIREAQQWSAFARTARSLPMEDGRRGRS